MALEYQSGDGEPISSNLRDTRIRKGMQRKISLLDLLYCDHHLLSYALTMRSKAAMISQTSELKE